MIISYVKIFANVWLFVQSCPITYNGTIISAALGLYSQQLGPIHKVFSVDVPAQVAS